MFIVRAGLSLGTQSLSTDSLLAAVQLLLPLKMFAFATVMKYIHVRTRITLCTNPRRSRSRSRTRLPAIKTARPAVAENGHGVEEEDGATPQDRTWLTLREKVELKRRQKVSKESAGVD